MATVFLPSSSSLLLPLLDASEDFPRLRIPPVILPFLTFSSKRLRYVDIGREELVGALAGIDGNSLEGDDRSEDGGGGGGIGKGEIDGTSSSGEGFAIPSRPLNPRSRSSKLSMTSDGGGLLALAV